MATKRLKVLVIKDRDWEFIPLKRDTLIHALPYGCSIVDFQDCPEVNHREILCAHPDWPEVPEDAEIPVVDFIPERQRLIRSCKQGFEIDYAQLRAE